MPRPVRGSVVTARALIVLVGCLFHAPPSSADLEREDILRWGGCSVASPKLGPCQEASTGAELREALANQTVFQVVLLQNVTVLKADFPDAIVVERELVIRGERPGVTLFVDDYYEYSDPGRNWVRFHSHLVVARLTMSHVLASSSFFGYVADRGMDFSGPGYDGSVESYCRCTSVTTVEVHSLILTSGDWDGGSGRQAAVEVFEARQLSGPSGLVIPTDTGHLYFQKSTVHHPGYIRRGIDTYLQWTSEDDHGIDISKLAASTECQTPELRGQDYVGNLNITNSGRECLPWSQTGFPGYSFSGADHNFCRSFGGLPGPWCIVRRNDAPADSFTSPHEIPESGLTFEFCPVPECPGHEDCWKLEDQGFSYRGHVNQTASGAPCSDWDKEFPSLFGYVPDNVCRNPIGILGKERPWCFTGARYNFEFCDIPVCEGPRLPASNTADDEDESRTLVVIIISAASAASVLALGICLALFHRHRTGTSAPQRLESCLVLSRNLESIQQEMLSKSPADLGLVELNAVIGKGAFSQVWSGRWCMANAAIKIVNLRALTAETSARIRNGVEANTLQKLSHPNIVQTFHVYKVQDVNQPTHLGELKVGEKYEEVSSEGSSVTQDMVELWLIQELCEKGDLSVYRNTFQPMDDGKYAKILILLCEIALALKFLHDVDIVHGDLKGQNIIMKATDGRDTAKVADFGMAHRLEGLQSYNSSSQYAGDIRYLSPEMLESNEVSAAMDIYSFGALMYECYTGQDYRLANSLAGHVKSVLSGVRPELPPHCPEPYKELVRRCWDASPLQRPSADELVERLEALHEARAGGAPPSAMAHRVGQGGMLRVVNPTSPDSTGYLVPSLPWQNVQQEGDVSLPHQSG